MDAEEIGRLIGELENRVERLRSLYEQYFMGIERIEPLTMRKDVDRRLWALRREQIRNTGLRFKLETTIQRYNTYQQYWQRIVREIEQGTYQRDFGRAAQRFGDNVVTAFARRRQKMYEKGLTKKAERDALRTGPAASEAPPAGADDAPPSSNETYDVTFEDADASEPVVAERVAAPEPMLLEPLELDIGGRAVSSEPVASATPVQPKAATPVGKGTPFAPTTSPNKIGAVPPGATPATPGVVRSPPARPGAAATHGQAALGAPKPAAPSVLGGPAGAPLHGAKPAAGPAPAAAAAAPKPAAGPAPPPAAAAPKPAAASTPGAVAPKPGVAPFPAPAAGAAPKPGVAPNLAGSVPKPAGPVLPVAKPVAPATAPKPAAASATAVGTPAKPAVAAPEPTAAARTPAAAASGLKPAAQPANNPAVAPQRPAAPSRPEVQSSGSGDENSLSPIRMRQIYGAFVEAKRRANESTASVTYEKIASNLESVAKELRAKHNARSVDFEVVMKNGKPVLKPVVKG